MSMFDGMNGSAFDAPAAATTNSNSWQNILGTVVGSLGTLGNTYANIKGAENGSQTVYTGTPQTPAQVAQAATPTVIVAPAPPAAETKSNTSTIVLVVVVVLVVAAIGFFLIRKK